MAHDSAVWLGILRDFRDGYAAYGDSAFSILALTREERERCPDEKYSMIALVPLPSGEGAYYMAARCLDFLDRPTLEPCGEFLRIAARAGAHLPPEVRSKIPVEPADALSTWLTFLWYLAPPAEEDRHAFLPSPFLEAAEAIECCRLTTEKPVFPSPDNSGTTQVELADLLRFAEREMKGNQRRVVEMVIKAGGTKSIADIAFELRWGNPSDNFNSCRREISAKIRSQGWDLERRDSEAVIVKLPTGGPSKNGQK